MKKTRIIILISIISGMLACSDSEDSNPIEISSIALNKTSITLHEGDEIVLSPTIYPENASDKTVVWKSTDSQVATVTDGKVKALQKGTTVITAWAGNKTATCDVTVVADVVVDKITLDKTTLSLAIEEEATLIATISPKEASEKIVVWTSDKPEVASVDDKGRIKGLKKGSALITAAAGGKSARCTVTVTDSQAEEISLDKYSFEMHTTDRMQLVASVIPANVFTTLWETSDKTVAVVDEKGVVKATGAGTATITASVGGKTATCDLKVKPTIIIGGEKRTLWKNGEIIKITEYQSPSTIQSVFIDEGYIYIGGTLHSEGYYDRNASISKIETPILGQEGDIKTTTTLMERKGYGSFGTSLFISDKGEIYLAGYDRFNVDNNRSYKAALWKNGKIQHLTDNESEEAYANAVFVSGEDVYVGGTSKGSIPALWKNGIRQKLDFPQGSIGDGDVNAIFVSNSDVYVAGYTRFPSLILPTVPRWKPTLWKNGVPQILDEEGGTLYSIFVVGNDVYAAGSGNSGGPVWKNGITMNYDNYDLLTLSIYVHDENVYKVNGEGLWINGVKQSWGQSGYGSSVFVK